MATAGAGYRHVALVLAAALLLTRPASADDIDVQATLGFSDTFRLGYWAPLTVTVGNRGPHLRGELQVRLTYRDALKDARFTKTHRRALDIARDSRKRLRFTVFIEAFAVPLEIRIVADGRELARHSVNLRRKFTQAPLLVVLSRDANLDYLNDSAGRRLRVVYPHPELLPDHWQGYDAVTALVVHGVSLETLSQRQFEALQRWLAQGGRLIVSGGPDYSLLRRPRLASLLPAAPSGLVTVGDAGALADALGEPLADVPFHVHRLTAVRGRVLYRVDEQPLAVERSTGRGAVTYLAFDIASPPFDRWPGMRNLWFRVLPTGHQPDAFPRRELRAESPVPALLDRPTGGLFGHGTMLLFLLLYLGGLATVYHLQPRASMARRTLPALIAACPLAFAAAGYVLFGGLLFPTGASVVVASVVEPLPPSPYAVVRFDLGLFSRQPHALRVGFDNLQPGFIASLRGPRWGTTSSYSVRDGALRSLEIDDARPYVLHMLRATDIAPYDVQVSGLREDGGVRLAVRNNTGQSWRDAWLFHRGSVYRLGTVGHNDGVPLTLAARAVYHEFVGDSWQRALREAPLPEGIDAHLAATALAAALERPVGDLNPDEALLAALVPSPVRVGGPRLAPGQLREVAIALLRFSVTPAGAGDAAR